MRRRRADRSQARQEPVLGMDQTLAAIRDQIKPRLDDPAEFRFILDRSVRRLMRVGYSSPMARLFVDACVEAARREKAKEDSKFAALTRRDPITGKEQGWEKKLKQANRKSKRPR